MSFVSVCLLQVLTVNPVYCQRFHSRAKVNFEVFHLSGQTIRDFCMMWHLSFILVNCLDVGINHHVHLYLNNSCVKSILEL